jgi:hypothetical protein
MDGFRIAAAHGTVRGFSTKRNYSIFSPAPSGLIVSKTRQQVKDKHNESRIVSSTVQM